MKIGKYFSVLKNAAAGFVKNDTVTMGAAVAFYTSLSLTPVLFILITIFSFFGLDIKEFLTNAMETLLGPTARDALDAIISDAQRRRFVGKITFMVAIFILVFTSAQIFSQFQKGMNKIWHMPGNSDKKIRDWFKKRLSTFAMVMICGALLVTSWALHTILTVAFSGFGTFLQIANFMGAIAIFLVLFMIIYRILPQTRIPLTYTIFGATAASILFAMGNYGIAKYLRYTGISSIYGATGALAILLLWVYYSAMSVFFGSELMHAMYTFRRNQKDNNQAGNS
jgi:membrane protein